MAQRVVIKRKYLLHGKVDVLVLHVLLYKCISNDIMMIIFSKMTKLFKKIKREMWNMESKGECVTGQILQ